MDLVPMATGSFRTEIKPARRRWACLLPLGVIALGWFACGGLLAVLLRQQEVADAGAFRRLAANAEVGIRQRLATYTEALHAGASFVTASAEVTRREWRDFADSLDLVARHPGIRGIGVIYPVQEAELPAFLRRVRAGGAADFALKLPPGGEDLARSEHGVITYVEPEAINSPALGLDVMAEAQRREAAQVSRDYGKPRLTGRIVLIQESERRAACLLFVPVYRSRVAIDTVEARRSAHVAWVYAPFLFEELLEGSLGVRSGRLRLWFYEGDGASADRLLYASDPEATVGPPEHQSRIEAAGRTFTLAWQRGGDFVPTPLSPQIWTLVSGAVGTVLLAGLVWSLQTTGQRARDLAEVRTREALAAQQERDADKLRSERLMRAVTDGLPGMVAYWDSDLRCTFANRAYLEWFGRDPDLMRGMRMQDLLGETLFKANETYIRGALAGRPQAFERVLTKTNGALCHTWAQYVPDVAADGKTVNGFFVLVSDITDVKRKDDALRESQQRLQDSEEIMRLFAAHAPASVAMFDRDMRYLVHSRQWVADYHLEGQSIIGRSHYDVFPEIGERWKEIHQRCLNGAIETSEAELFVRADGSSQWLRWEVRPWHTSTGAIGGVVMFTQDISIRKSLEESLARARDEALEASRLKSEFLATVSHEIRTPMNAIIGMSGLLSESGLKPEQREMVRMVSSAGESLLTIINDILDFSRIEAGQLRLDPAAFDFRHLVEDAVALMAPRAQEKRLELTCEFTSAPSGLLLGDGGRVRQILLNLVGNAVKFTLAGEVAVTACLQASTGNRSRVRLEVRDTGVGIPREARDRLFRPFVQVDGSSTKRFGGTGLGLAISRQLVVAMKGEIGFESEVDRGSTFWVELEFEQREEIPPPPVPRLPAGGRILIVEKHATTRGILQRQLGRWGVECEVAGDAAEAFRHLRGPGSRPWNLILLEGNLAGSPVAEFGRELRSDPEFAEIPLVLLASGGAGPIGLDAVTVADLLIKPVTEQRLADCLDRVLGGRTDAPAAMPAGDAMARQAGTKLNLLLVEDNASNQRVASLLLAREGHRVDVAANGQEALERLAEQDFDAVLMDCQMPVLDGYEATRRIRSGRLPGVNPAVPVIALTSYAREEDRIQCLEAGMNDHVTKPMRMAELAAALARCGVGGRTSPATGTGAGVLDEGAWEVARTLPGAGAGSLLTDLVRLYLQDERASLATLRELLANRRVEPAAAAAHSLGGNAASFGGLGVRQAALDLERAVRAQDWSDAAARLEVLQAACARLRELVAERGEGQL